MFGGNPHEIMYKGKWNNVGKVILKFNKTKLLACENIISWFSSSFIILHWKRLLHETKHKRFLSDLRESFVHFFKKRFSLNQVNYKLEINKLLINSIALITFPASERDLCFGTSIYKKHFQPFRLIYYVLHTYVFLYCIKIFYC